MNEHIQNMQNPTSYTEYVKQYLDGNLQALANLGQRTLYNNNVLTYSSFSFADVITPENNNDDDYKFIALSKSNDIISLNIYNKKTNLNETFTIDVISDEEIYDLLNKLGIHKNENLINSIFVNHNVYDHYISKDDDGKITLIAKLGLYDDDPSLNIHHPVDLLYVQFKNSKINHLIYITPCDSNSNYSKSNGDQSFVLYQINNIDNKLKIILFSDQDIIKIIKKDILSYEDENNDSDNIDIVITDLYDYKSNEINNDTLIFSIFNEYSEDYFNLTNINESIEINQIPFISILMEYQNNENYNIIGDEFNIDIANDNFNINLDNSILNTYINDLDLSDLHFIKGYIENQYDLLVEQINQIENGSKQKIFIQIINQLYSLIKKSYNTAYDKLLVPLNYKFTYVCDKNNEGHIYFSNYINVLSYDIDKIKYDNINNNFIYYHDSANINNVSVWNFNCVYDDVYDVIKYIHVNKVYTMPYIDNLYNWVVNDVHTDINALNIVDNGIKLFVIYVDKNKDPQVLNINDSNILSKFTTFKKTSDISIGKKYFGQYNNDDITFSTYIPEIDNYNKDYFQNSFLYIITNKEMINEKNDNVQGNYYQEDYCMDYIYTLWNFDDIENKFKIVKDFNNDDEFFDPFNSNEVISVISNNKNNSVCAIKVQKNIIVDQTNQANSIENNKWIIQRNKISELYNDNYNNDLNLSTEVLSKYINGSDSVSYDNIDKFITQLNNISTTNSIYPKYTTKDIDITVSNNRIFNDEQVVQRNIDGIDIYINGDRVVSSNYINTENVNVIISEYREDVTTITEKIYRKSETDKYNEFVPNENVPTIDNKEMLMRNVNLVNRLNILKFSQDNATGIYNGYIGSQIDDGTSEIDNSALIIGTSNWNINMGTDTLLTPNQIDKFNKFDKLKTNGFNYVELNADQNIKSNKPLLNIIDDYLSTTIIPIGKIDNNNTLELQIINGDIYISYESNNYINNDVLFKTIKCSNNNFNAIYLNNLIEHIFGIKINNNSYTFKTDNLILDIYDQNNINKHYYFLAINNKVLNNENNDNNVYVFNKQLNITLNTTNQTFYIDFEDSNINTFTNDASNTIISKLFDKYSNNHTVQIYFSL